MRRTKIDLNQLPEISGMVNSVKEVTDTYLVLSEDSTIIANKETNFTITLPLATEIGKFYYFKNIGVGLVTIVTKGTDLLDNTNSIELMQWDTISIQCYSSGKWMMMVHPIGRISTLLDIINGESV